MDKARAVLLAHSSDNYSILCFSIPQNNQMRQAKRPAPTKHQLYQNLY